MKSKKSDPVDFSSLAMSLANSKPKPRAAGSDVPVDAPPSTDIAASDLSGDRVAADFAQAMPVAQTATKAVPETASVPEPVPASEPVRAEAAFDPLKLSFDAPRAQRVEDSTPPEPMSSKPESRSAVPDSEPQVSPSVAAARSASPATPAKKPPPGASFWKNAFGLDINKAPPASQPPRAVPDRALPDRAVPARAVIVEAPLPDDAAMMPDLDAPQLHSPDGDATSHALMVEQPDALTVETAVRLPVETVIEAVDVSDLSIPDTLDLDPEPAAQAAPAPEVLPFSVETLFEPRPDGARPDGARTVQGLPPEAFEPEAHEPESLPPEPQAVAFPKIHSPAPAPAMTARPVEDERREAVSVAFEVPVTEMTDPMSSAGAIQVQAVRAATASAEADRLAVPLEPAASVQTRVRVAEPKALPVVIGAVVVGALWSLGPVAFAVAYQGGLAAFANQPFALMVLAMLALGPIGLVALAAYVFHQGRKLSAEARRTRMLADNLIGPAALAAGETGLIVDHIRNQIAATTSTAAQAREDLIAMSEVIALETRRLADSTGESVRATKILRTNLTEERTAINGMTEALNQTSAKVSMAIAEQARMVSDAADLAEAQLREAEATLAARAADLISATSEAADITRSAGADLAEQVGRLGDAGLHIGEQLATVEVSLAEQRSGLVEIAQSLRADQEGFDAQLESRQARLSEFVTVARSSAGEIGEQAVRSSEVLNQALSSAGEQVQALSGLVQAQKQAILAENEQALLRMAQAVATERQNVESGMKQSVDMLVAATLEARQSADAHLASTEERLGRINEATIDSARLADASFEARLNEARLLITRSAGLVEEAGSRTVAQLNDGITAAQSSISQMQTMLAQIDERIARLPQEARSQSEAIRANVEQSMQDLLETARRASEETQTIDSAFQDRVRRNYEMLSEAARLMGNVTSAAKARRVVADPPAPSDLPPAPALAPEPAAPAPVIAAQNMSPPIRPEQAHTTEARPTEARSVDIQPAAIRAEADMDLEIRDVFEGAGQTAPPAAEPNGSWGQVLANLDQDPEVLGESLAAEISVMGIDPAALLPANRVEAIAMALHAGDRLGGREVVRRLAPAAIRRLVRRLFTDDSMRGKAESFIKQYGSIVDRACQRSRDPQPVVNLLSSELGRAYLMLDAAGGDLV